MVDSVLVGTFIRRFCGIDITVASTYKYVTGAVVSGSWPSKPCLMNRPTMASVRVLPNEEVRRRMPVRIDVAVGLRVPFLRSKSYGGV